MDVVIVADFDWDDGNRDKCGKHGVSPAEIESVFRSEPLVAPDIAHSQSETRYLAIGQALSGRHVFVAFTLRERDGSERIRPISARYMHQEEVERYEQASADPHE